MAIFRFDHDFGGVPFDKSAAPTNTDLLRKVLQSHGSNNTFVFPENVTFYLYNGVRVAGLQHATLQIDGTLHFLRPNRDHACEFDEEFDYKGHPHPCFACKDCHNITLTSKSRRGGVINGGGPDWWGIPWIGYISIRERRPYLLFFNGTTHLHINNIDLIDAPFYNMMLTNVNHSEIHHVNIATRRSQSETHGMLDLSALNTDGIDVAGHNIHIHDVSIWTQDDCIAVKDNFYGNRVSSNMTFERIHASGLGLVIGSISGTTIQNITFRDSFLYRTFKGIYTKFRLPQDDIDIGPGLIADIVYQNITMESPLQWPIWIGPAQQTRGDSAWLCDPSPCSLCWPNVPFQQCDVVPDAMYRNITLANVRIRNPAGSPGVIMGDHSQLIEGITFENVTVEDKSDFIPHRELHSMFPSLDLPVHDRFAKTTVSTIHWAVGFLVVSVGLYFFMKGRALYTRASETTEPGNSIREHPALRRAKASCLIILQLLAVLAFAVISVIVLVLIYDMAFVVPKTKSPSHYFICEGVSNGKAIGTTFPVPECFTDMTKTKHEDLGRSGPEKYLSNEIVLLVGIIVLVLINVGLIRQIRRRSSSATPPLDNEQYESVALDEEGNLNNVESVGGETNIEDGFILLAEDEEGGALAEDDDAKDGSVQISERD